MTTLKNLFLVTFFCVLGSFGVGCNKTSVSPHDTSPNKNLPANFSKGAFILNEGNFGWGVTTVDFLSFEKDTIYADIFAVANNNAPLGNVVQSMLPAPDCFLLSVNNSQKVEIVNNSNFKRQKTINGLRSPRYMALSSNSDKVFITDLYDTALSVAELKSGQVLSRINLGFSSEKIARFKDKILVCAGSLDYKTGQFLVIDEHSQKIIQRINLESMPLDMTLNGNTGQVWLALAASDTKNGSICCLEYNTNYTLAQQSTLPNFKPRKICYDEQEKKLYVLAQNTVYTTNTSHAKLELFLSFPSAQIIYNMSVNTQRKELYLTEALDYVQKGKLLVYDLASKKLKKTYRVGVIPSEILFTD